MGLDNHTVILYGWKIDDSEKVAELIEKCEDINEDFWDDYTDEIFIDDYMCGNYFYFGAILCDYDADDETEVIVNDELVKKSTAKYNKFVKENPEISKVFDEYKNGEAQLYVFQHIW